MDSFNYTFAALRGVQAKREYFVAMCPLRLIPRIFLFNEDELPPEMRAQRLLNRARVPAIARYLTENADDYVFSALTASIDGDMIFQPVDDNKLSRNIGQLIIPMSARFVINDGQHRRAAIEEALREQPDLGDETIAVVFFADAGLRRSQQLFADLNTHAVRGSSSIGILYDLRDPLSQVARTVATEVPAFKGLTDMERSTIPNRSLKLFTLSGIYFANAALLQKTNQDLVTDDEERLAVEFWTALSYIIPEWDERIIRNIASAELRRDYVHVHSVTLQAIAMAGSDLIASYPNNWQERLQALRFIDWSRSNTILWEGRAMIGGQMSKARSNIVRTASALKQILRLPLSPQEQRLEKGAPPVPFPNNINEVTV
jgi:DNA sulfur modification protein DndB